MALHKKMTPPKSLTGEALDYWKRHAQPLEDAGILTDRDRDSFALLCRIWGLINDLDVTPGEDNFRAMIQFVNLTKQYQSLAKQFGLLPRERKVSKMDMEKATLDEFGF